VVAEAEDHAIGRSRVGLTTKVHGLTDGLGRPLVLLLTAGKRQRHQRTLAAMGPGDGAPHRTQKHRGHRDPWTPTVRRPAFGRFSGAGLGAHAIQLRSLEYRR
jgi:hypothetical protein